MADGVDIDLYSDDIDQNFGQMKVRIIYLIQLKHFILVLLRFLRKILFDFSKINLFWVVQRKSETDKMVFAVLLYSNNIQHDVFKWKKKKQKAFFHLCKLFSVENIDIHQFLRKKVIF